MMKSLFSMYLGMLFMCLDVFFVYGLIDVLLNNVLTIETLMSEQLMLWLTNDLFLI